MEYFESKCPDCKRTYQWKKSREWAGFGYDPKLHNHRSSTVCKYCGSQNVQTKTIPDEEDNTRKSMAPTVLAPPVHPRSLPPPPPDVGPLNQLLTALSAKTKAADAQAAWSDKFGTAEEKAITKAVSEAYHDALKLVRDVLRFRG